MGSMYRGTTKMVIRIKHTTRKLFHSKKAHMITNLFFHTVLEGTTVTNKMVTKDKNKIKTILDIIYKIQNKQNGSFEWIGSQLNEDAKSYTYELKYQETVFNGDWGINDRVDTIIITQSINKDTGEVGKPKTTEGLK